MEVRIDSLDHVAIRVKHLEQSADWYHKMLGLKRIQPAEWGEFPIFMVSEDGSGVALFPLLDHPEGAPIKVDHFAFRIDPKAFKEIQKYFDACGLKFQFQDHIYFHSIYFEDPDGHTVELTTPVKSLPGD